MKSGAGAANMRIVISSEDRRWAAAWPGRGRDVRTLIRAAAAADAAAGRAGGALEVVLSANASVRALNAQFRGKDTATNVLSFANPSQPPGSIILAFETVAAEAETQGKAFISHSKHLILHGFLHLCGYDHETVAERRLMERLEIRILAAMGISNPYLVESVLRR
jgi:probable rRNA maturation factor